MSDIVQQGRLIADWVRGLGYATYADDIEALAAAVERLGSSVSPLRPEDRDFLARVLEREPLRPADRVQDRIRQRCRQKGWVVYEGEWRITPAGSAALAAREAANG